MQTERDKLHTATPEDEQRTIRQLLNLIPPCEDCGTRQCLAWLMQYVKHFATQYHDGNKTLGLPLALLSNFKSDKPKPEDVPHITIAQKVYRY